MQESNIVSRRNKHNIKLLQKVIICSAILFGAASNVVANSHSNSSDENEDLINKYIQSKGTSIIVFDASNIKQYWIDKSVVSRNDFFSIILDENKELASIPLRIQLANVAKTQDCKVEIIADTKDFSFSIVNSKSQILSKSSAEDSFLRYSIASSVFHLEDTFDLSFNLVFSSKKEEIISIKKVILSFADNKNYLVSPGVLKITNKNTVSNNSDKAEINSNSFSVTGKRSSTLSSNKIIISDNPVSSSVKIKNIGEEAVTVYCGYAAYSKEHFRIDGKNYPYKESNKELNVLSSSVDSNTIIVDSYSDWVKGSYLAVDAKEDKSDIPNNAFLDGRIVEIKQIEDNRGEITLDKPLKTSLKDNSKIRVHGTGGAYLYYKIKKLLPNEEEVIQSSMKINENSIQYASNAGFPRGTYYIVPIILSYSADPSKDNIILIEDFNISY